MVFLNVEQVEKTYSGGAGDVHVLSGITFSLEKGESLAVTGPSGSGKSTLLHVIGTLDHPSSGHVRIHDTDPQTLSDHDLAAFRNSVIGFVFQDHHLLPQYSALENVLLPTRATKRRDPNATPRAESLLERVGLTHRRHHRPSELSGGERQRVAIARALVNRPELLLCDEPTGNLDGSTAKDVADLLFDLQKDTQRALIIVTHDLELARKCQRRANLSGGHLSM